MGFTDFCLAPAQKGDGENALTDVECWNLFCQVGDNYSLINSPLLPETEREEKRGEGRENGEGESEEQKCVRESHVLFIENELIERVIVTVHSRHVWICFLNYVACFTAPDALIGYQTPLE